MIMQEQAEKRAQQNNNEQEDHQFNALADLVGEPDEPKVDK